MLRLAARLSLGLLMTVPILAQQTAPNPTATRLTIEDVLRWRIPYSPRMSPGGRHIAFLIRENDFQRSAVTTQLWWLNVESREVRRVVQSDANVTALAWSPDGRLLAFLSARGGDEATRKPQVFLLPVDGGEAFALTRAPEGVSSFRWSSDSKSIFFVANEAVPAAASAFKRRQQERKDDSYAAPEPKPRREIWRIALEDRKSQRLWAGDPGLDEIAPSPDGKWLVFHTNYTGERGDAARGDLWLLDVAQRTAKQLTKRDGNDSSPAWSPDSTRIAFLAPRVSNIFHSQPEVFIVPVQFTGEPPEPKRISQDFIGNIDDLQWPAAGEGILFSAAVGTGNRLFRLNPAGGVPQPISEIGLFLSDPDCIVYGTLCTAIVETRSRLPEVAVIPSRGPQPVPQVYTELNLRLRNFAVSAPEVIRWTATDGLEIEGVIVKPPDWQAGKKYPLLLDIHGGPYGRRANTLASNAAAQAWAARGWLVLQPNFRGSSAYGHDFGIANYGDIGGKDFDDILAGVDFVIAQGWADESRMAVMGGSYGGFMTNHLIARTNRFKAAASLYGIFSLITDWSNSNNTAWELNYLQKYYWEDFSLYLDRSPAKFAARITTPVLVMHGDLDNNTFVSNSLEMVQALRVQGREVRFVRFPREGHGFREPNHKLEEFRLIAAWLEEHTLGGEGRARLVSETASSKNWELRVSALRAPQNYAGVRPKGRFLEVEVYLRATNPSAERLNLLIFDSAGSEVALSASEPGASAPRSIFPIGLAAESLSERVLVRSSAQTVTIEPDSDGRNTALAISVVFDVPVGAREFLLRVKDFAPIKIELPIE